MAIQKLNRETLIEAMNAAGYSYDEYGDRIGFIGGLGQRPMEFYSWAEVEEWLNGVVFDDPSISDAVEKIMHPVMKKFTICYSMSSSICIEAEDEDTALELFDTEYYQREALDELMLESIEVSAVFEE